MTVFARMARAAFAHKRHDHVSYRILTSIWSKSVLGMEENGRVVPEVEGITFRRHFVRRRPVQLATLGPPDSSVKDDVFVT